MYMMMNDKKKIAMLIVGNGKTKDNSPKNNESVDQFVKRNDKNQEDDNLSGEEIASKELLDAIKANNPKDLLEAFKSLMELCDPSVEQVDSEVESEND